MTHCGTHTNDCTTMSGVKSASCIGKKCFAEDCAPGYHLNSIFDSDGKERTICEEDTHDACGSINHQCGSEEICTQGKCKNTCLPGEVVCGGSCINPNTSTKFCGADTSCSSFIPCSEFEDCIGRKPRRKARSRNFFVSRPIHQTTNANTTMRNALRVASQERGTLPIRIRGF